MNKPPAFSLQPPVKGSFLSLAASGWRLAAALAVSGLALLAVACIQGQKVPPPNCVFIVTATNSPTDATPGTVALVYNADLSSQMFPVFDLVVHGPVTKAYGMAFRLVYDPAVIELSGRTLPSDPAVLNTDGASTSFIANTTAVPGKILVGLTRLAGRTGGIDFPDAANVVARLHFRASGAGTMAFQFEDALIADESYGSTQTGLPGFTWLAGDVTTVQECL